MMAHFALVGTDNIVKTVIVIDNSELLDENGAESEELGRQFCKQFSEGMPLFSDGTWIQTSYNRSFRKNYASIGYTYDESLDAFIPPKPERFPSFAVNPATGLWEPPIPKPEGDYYWDEKTISWVKGTPPPLPTGEQNV